VTVETEDRRVVLERHPLPYRILIRAVTFFGAMVLLVWYKTLRVTVIGGETERELRRKQTMFYATFHRGVIWTIYFWRWRKGFYLASSSKDGEWAVGLIKAFGNHAVRGSSSRGGKLAIQGMVDALRSGISGGIIPDAPKGPERVCKIGTLVAAQRAGVSIVPVAIHADRCWRLRGWDRTIFPKPFSRFVVKFGEPFTVDPALSGPALEARLAEFDAVMNRIADDADTFFGAPPEDGPWRKKS
jgi:lysophospholipid acyltransferase (LPLAT)-like uncharacterized protein